MGWDWDGWDGHHMSLIGLLSSPSVIITPFSGIAIFKVEPNYTFIHMNLFLADAIFNVIPIPNIVHLIGSNMKS